MKITKYTNHFKLKSTWEMFTLQMKKSELFQDRIINQYFNEYSWIALY